MRLFGFVSVRRLDEAAPDYVKQRQQKSRKYQAAEQAQEEYGHFNTHDRAYSATMVFVISSLSARLWKKRANALSIQGVQLRFQYVQRLVPHARIIVESTV